MSPRVLLIEDDDNIHKIMAARLRTSGYDVLEASDGIEALSLLEKDPKLVILDIYMPRMNGIEFLQKLKKDPRHKRTPVIITTVSKREEELVGHVKGVNIAGFYIKSETELKEILEKILEVVRPS